MKLQTRLTLAISLFVALVALAIVGHALWIHGDVAPHFVQIVTDLIGQKAATPQIAAELSRFVQDHLREIIREEVGFHLAALSATLLLFLLLGAMLAAWVTRRLVHPIHQLIDHAKRLGQGEMSTPVPPLGQDEWGILAATLEGLRQNVVRSYDQLQANNQELLANQRASLEIRHQSQLIENAMQAKSAFLANMSHEIRSPMNAVVGMTELALATDLSREQRQYLDIVMNSANVLLALINNILDYSKIEVGKLELERIEFDPIQVMEQVCEILAVSAHRKQVTLCHEFDPALPQLVVGDPLRLQQVLTNLVANGIKFTNLGEVAVHMGLDDQTTGDKIGLKVTVRDTGVGLPADKLEDIFGCFAQGESGTARLYGGSGLGLAISRQLVALMGGRLQVTSRPNLGSTFYFTAMVDKVPTAPAAGFFATEIPKGPFHILVAEHHTATRHALVRLLSWQQIQVTEAADAATALQLLTTPDIEKNPFHMILLDGQLPDLPESSLLGLLEMPPWTQRIALMLPTGLRRAHLPGCENLTIVRGLIKPIKRAELAEAMTAVLCPATHPTAHPHILALQQGGKHSHKILLVEDNVENQFLVLQILGQQGYLVTVAVHGDNVAELLSRQHFDLILMDLHLPGVDGFQLTAAIRSGQLPGVDPNIPIIALTASALVTDRQRCHKLGMNAFLAKPYKPRELLQLTRRLITNQETVTATVPPPSASSEPISANPAKLEQFLTQTHGTLSELERLVQQGYWSPVETLASRLRDAAQEVEATHFRNLALLLMMAARSGKSANATSGLVLMRQELESLEKKLGSTP